MPDRTTEQRVPALRPQSTVLETADGKLHVVMEMPGVRQEDLDVRVDGNELRVVGRRPQPQGARGITSRRGRSMRPSTRTGSTRCCVTAS